MNTKLPDELYTVEIVYFPIAKFHKKICDITLSLLI